MEEAQEYADTIHLDLIVADSNYARSVQRGQTVKWANAYQDLDEAEVPKNGNWYCNLKQRAFYVVKDEDKGKLKPYKDEE